MKGGNKGNRGEKLRWESQRRPGKAGERDKASGIRVARGWRNERIKRKEEKLRKEEIILKSARTVKIENVGLVTR